MRPPAVSPRSRSVESRPMRAGRGYSLTEMVITISLIGTLAAIAVVSMSGTLGASKDAIAQDKLERLNSAVQAFNQCNAELQLPSLAGSADDEMLAVRVLQYRNPDDDKALLGSPYLTPTYNPTTSSDTKEFRLSWTGTSFKLVRPGEMGVGLHVVFDGSDNGSPFAFPPNFNPYGR